MLSLVVRSKGRMLESYEFTSEERIVIGRHEQCEVTLDHEGISRRHCEIVKTETGGYLLRDMGSSNGTYVRGRRIKTYNLNPGDSFSICDLTLKYNADPAEVEEFEKPEAAIVAPNLTYEVDRAAEIKKLRSASHSRVRGHLIVQEPNTPSRNLILHQAVLSIGTDPEADLPLARKNPRLAALIIREDLGFRCLDVSPKGNAVTINGAKTEEAVLERGDDIAVGNLTLKFFSGLPQVGGGPTRKWTHPGKPGTGRY